MTAPSFSRSSAHFEKDEQTLTLAVVDGSVDFDTTADRIVRNQDEQGVAAAYDGGKLSTRNGFAWLAMQRTTTCSPCRRSPCPRARGPTGAPPSRAPRARNGRRCSASSSSCSWPRGRCGGRCTVCSSGVVGAARAHVRRALRTGLGAALPLELAGARGLRRLGDPLEIAVSVTAFLLVARHAWAQKRHHLASARDALAAEGFVAFDDVVASAADTRKERKQGPQTARQVGGRAERKRLKRVRKGYLDHLQAWARHGTGVDEVVRDLV